MNRRILSFGWWCGLLSGSFCALYFGGGSRAPDPDPRVGESMDKMANLAQQQFDWYKNEYQTNWLPREQRMDDLSAKVIQQNLSTAEENQQQARQQWGLYQNTFVPVERQMASDAMNYDSAPQLDKVAGEAAADVSQQFAGRRQQMADTMARYGVSPNSGRFVALNNQLAAQEAAASAGAMNTARDNRRQGAIALRAGAANFGRNMPNTAAQAYGLQMTGNNAALSARAGADNYALQGMNAMSGAYNNAISAYGNVANIGLDQSNYRMNQWANNYAMDSAESAGLGKFIGMNAAMGMDAYKSTMSSSKKVKTNKYGLNDERVLSAVQDLPVERWTYKDGVADEAEHIGPYAEDFQRLFGVGDGKTINVVDAVGVNLAAIKGLADKVDRLEKRLNGGHTR